MTPSAGAAMAIERYRTDDGSITLVDVDRDLTYRSRHGARTESRHVFVELLRRSAADPVRVVELGFGGATNFCETFTELCEQDRELTYVAVECAPVLASLLTHPNEPALAVARDALASPGEPAAYANITLRVTEGRWRDVELSGPFDVLFHDPFGPRDEPEAWTVDVFERHRLLASDTALLGTYSAATHVRRAMAAAGFFVARRPGPGRKREVTIASPSPAMLTDFEMVFEP